MSEDLERTDAPTIVPIDEENQGFLHEALEVAQALGLPENVADLSELFAQRRAKWFADPEAERPDPSDFLIAVGVLIGERFARALDMEWVMYTDEDGDSLALMLDAEKTTEGETLYVFPFDGVAARWPDDGEGEIVDYYEGVCGYVKEQLAR